MKKLWTIFWTFFRIGILTFGGGYSMLPMLEHELVNKNHWISKEDILDFYALAQCVPGIIAANTASFVGRKIMGTRGAVAATLGVIVPSIMIIIIVAAFFHAFINLKIVQHAFAGIRVAVVALVVKAVAGMWKVGVKDVLALLICLACFLLSSFTSVSPILIVVSAALIGILVKGLKRDNGGKLGGNS